MMIGLQSSRQHIRYSTAEVDESGPGRCEIESTNIQPVSAIQLLERLVAWQLLGYLTTTKLLRQFAYHVHHSTETADILRVVNNGDLAVLTTTLNCIT